MLKVIIGVVFALLVVRYWSDLTAYMDSMIRGDNGTAVEATDAPAKKQGEGEPEGAPEAKPETIIDRLHKAE